MWAVPTSQKRSVLGGIGSTDPPSIRSGPGISKVYHGFEVKLSCKQPYADVPQYATSDNTQPHIRRHCFCGPQQNGGQWASSTFLMPPLLRQCPRNPKQTPRMMQHSLRQNKQSGNLWRMHARLLRYRRWRIKMWRAAGSVRELQQDVARRSHVIPFSALSL